VAETNSLLNCRRGNPTGGSNPPLSAEKAVNFDGLFSYLLILSEMRSAY
jgi:hypothetical protein